MSEEIATQIDGANKRQQARGGQIVGIYFVIVQSVNEWDSNGAGERMEREKGIME